MATTAKSKKQKTVGYQVWSYTWSNGHGPIPERLLFGGTVYATRALAESAWYDTMPGLNSKATFVKVEVGQ